MTTPTEKTSPKGAEIPSIGQPLNPLERFLRWLKQYATLLSTTGVVVLVVIGTSALLWQMTATRFDDTAARIDDTKAEVMSVENRPHQSSQRCED